MRLEDLVRDALDELADQATAPVYLADKALARTRTRHRRFQLVMAGAATAACAVVGVVLAPMLTGQQPQRPTPEASSRINPPHGQGVPMALVCFTSVHQGSDGTRITRHWLLNPLTGQYEGTNQYVDCLPS